MMYIKILTNRTQLTVMALVEANLSDRKIVKYAESEDPNKTFPVSVLLCPIFATKFETTRLFSSLQVGTIIAKTGQLERYAKKECQTG